MQESIQEEQHGTSEEVYSMKLGKKVCKRSGKEIGKKVYNKSSEKQGKNECKISSKEPVKSMSEK